MWRLCVWFLGLFRRRTPKGYMDVDINKSLINWTDKNPVPQETWEKEVVPVEMTATGEYRTAEPRKLLSPTSFEVVYDPLPPPKWEVAQLTWPDGNIQWIVIWNIPEWPADGSDPLFHHHSVHETQEVAEKVAAELNKPPADPTGGDH